jgi:hypothetical protein
MSSRSSSILLFLLMLAHWPLVELSFPLFAGTRWDLTLHSGIDNSEMDVTKEVSGDSSKQDLAIEIWIHGCCFYLF